MLGKFLRVIQNSKTRSIVKKNIFHFYNQVPKFDPSKDYYQILEVGKESNDSDIKRSYYRLAKSYHPDSNPGK
jgi:preprotein translocase subunit Sec63